MIVASRQKVLEEGRARPTRTEITCCAEEFVRPRRAGGLVPEVFLSKPQLSGFVRHVLVAIGCPKTSKVPGHVP